MIISGTKDTIAVGLGHGNSKDTLILISIKNDTALYQQPYPGFPANYILKYDTVSKKMVHSMNTQTDHYGRWYIVARSI